MTFANTATPRKTALVTGATNGIGKVTALELARMGHRVLLTSRDAAKGERVLEEIRGASGHGALELYVGDLSSLGEVRRMALEIRAQHPTLDILVNNAGGLFTERQTTADGLEYTFAFNHLAYFLLTRLLLEPLKAAAHARVLSVSSSAHYFGRMRWDDLEFRTGYSGWAAYNQSKLMNVLFANALARRLNGTGVTSNSLHPGLVSSGFGSHSTGFNGVFMRLIKPFSITPAQGAQTSLYLATSREVEGVSGQYFDREKQRRAKPVAYDETAQQKLWALSEGLVSRYLDPV